MPHFRALPSTIDLPDTLAKRLSHIREFRNMTPLDLAQATRFTVKRIEDLESGLETWLSAPDRQILAHALAIQPRVLKEVETQIQRTISAEPGPQEIRQIGDDILRGLRDLTCPACGSQLQCSLQEGFDLEGNPIQLPKAFCSNCPWILRY